MPFTLAHPAAAWPLGRLFRRLDGVALVVGSFMPDLPHMILVGPSREVTHTLGASVWFCLPLAIPTYLFARAFLIEALVMILPDALHQRITPAVSGWAALRGRAWPWVVLSLWLGTLTHVVWDAFTHFTSPLVQASEFLRLELTEIAGQRLEVFNLLQHGSTVLGLLLIVYWFSRWTGQTQTSSRPTRGELQRSVLFGGVVGIPVAFGLVGMSRYLFEHGVTTVSFTIAAKVAGFTFMPALTFAVLILGMVWPFLRGRVGDG